MPTIGRRESSALKEYGWLVFIAALLIGLWLTAPMMSGTGSDSVAIAVSGDENEQSLRSLDPAGNPQGAPGGVLGADAVGGAASADGQMSSLYVSPGGAAGEPISEERAAEIQSGGGSSLAEAMARVADSGKAPDDGWSGKAARTGLSRPKASFSKVGETRGGDKGSSSAQFVVKKTFGTGGDPGLDLAASGGGASGPHRRGMNKADGGGAENRTLNELRDAEKLNLDALKGGDERAARGGRTSFDAGGNATSAMGELASAGSAPGLASDAGVPLNLKANDPKKLNNKEFKPPEIKASEVKNSDNKRYMEQQMMMMMLQVALTGVMGPMGGAVGGMMTSALQMNGPSG